MADHTVMRWVICSAHVQRWVSTRPCCPVFTAGPRSSPFALSGFDGIVDERGLSHSFNCPGLASGLHSGPPSVLSVEPPSSEGPPSAPWKPAAPATQPSSVAVSRGQATGTADVGRFSSNMQVGIHSNVHTCWILLTRLSSLYRGFRSSWKVLESPPFQGPGKFWKSM